jgi:hypothetical protein
MREDEGREKQSLRKKEKTTDEKGGRKGDF